MGASSSLRSYKRESRDDATTAKKPDKEKPKKTLRDVCVDLKKASTERIKVQERQAKQVTHDADYDRLLREMYGPRIDPIQPLRSYQGIEVTRAEFEALVQSIFDTQRNRLPLVWASGADYLQHCVNAGWVDMDDSNVVILPSLVRAA